MRAEDFLEVFTSEGARAALEQFSEDELAEIDEPRLAAAALAAKLNLDYLENVVEDFE